MTDARDLIRFELPPWATLSPGSVYFMHVCSDGSERRFGCEVFVVKTLRVEVMDDGTEETHTRSRYRPVGRGWEGGQPSVHGFRWRRARATDSQVVAIGRNRE